MSATTHTGQGQSLADAVLAALGTWDAAAEAALLSGIDPAGGQAAEGAEITLPYSLPQAAHRRAAQALQAQPPATAMREGIGGWAVGEMKIGGQ